MIDQAFRDYLDEQWELRLPAGYPEGEPVFYGREGVTQLLAMLRDAWVEWRFEPNASLTRGTTWSCSSASSLKGAGSGAPIELKDAHVVTIRDGRLKSSRVYRDRSKALKAAGLRE